MGFLWSVTLAAVLCGAAAALGDKEERVALANQVAALNQAYFEAQRAGVKGPVAKNYPQVWKWKEPAFTAACPTVYKQYGSSTGAFSGTFEAGNTVIVTGITAYSASQLVLGASYFHNTFKQKAEAVIPDTAGCLPKATTANKNTDLFQATFKQLAESLLGAIVQHNRKDTGEFVMITGVSDSTCFNDDKSWEQPAEMQDRCYVADSEHPAGDIAAGTATALALLAYYFRNAPGTPAALKGALASACEDKAVAAFHYAEAMYEAHGDEATCALSTATDNCVGACDGEGQSPCTLYGSGSGPQRHLFAAAAALYKLTGASAYRTAADVFWAASREAVEEDFLLNWDNVWGLGAAILSGSKDAKGGAKPRAFYRKYLATVVANWVECSENGAADGCERTDSGQAYPLHSPAGNIGMGLNAVCLAGIYNKVMPGKGDSAAVRSARCFMQRQLTATINAKCEGGDSMCNTSDDAGFSYIVGLGEHYPSRIHSRDASAHPFDNGANSEPDENTICGALVSGPDRYEGFADERKNYTQTEPAIDFASGMLCAFGAYADQPDGAFDDCDVERGPLTGQ